MKRKGPVVHRIYDAPGRIPIRTACGQEIPRDCNVTTSDRETTCSNCVGVIIARPDHEQHGRVSDWYMRSSSCRARQVPRRSFAEIPFEEALHPTKAERLAQEYLPQDQSAGAPTGELPFAKE